MLLFKHRSRISKDHLKKEREKKKCRSEINNMGLNKSSLTLLMVLAMAALTHARTDLFRPSFFRQFGT